ncbi:signal peptidase I [Haematococcus lacustris]|uniref:Signal peptidase complex catalytic subunit SEC11 n=1 Tax=Haematococcus lacustris TaxID=44745 RepID=A0A699YF56_HAELA|nr:signal peptidase I [Haematococcus lacustris]
MGKAPISTGEIVVFNINGRDIPIVHRVIKVHQRSGSDELLPNVGIITILMNDYPYLKFALIGVLGLLVITNKEG